jgi:hypothetical protein
LQNAIAAGWNTEFFSQGTPDGDVYPYTQAARRLPAVHPDVAKMPTVVALYKAFLGFISFDLYNYVMECCEVEDFWSF